MTENKSRCLSLRQDIFLVMTALFRLIWLLTKQHTSYWVGAIHSGDWPSLTHNGAHTPESGLRSPESVFRGRWSGHAQHAPDASDCRNDTTKPRQRQRQKQQPSTMETSTKGRRQHGVWATVRLQFSIRSVVPAVKGKSQPSTSSERSQKEIRKILSVRVPGTW